MSLKPEVMGIFKSTPEISPTDLNKRLGEFKVIDVRRPEEFTGELGHIKGAILATLETDLETYLSKLSKDAAYVFVCKSGGRSGVATDLALKSGFSKVHNMIGGMLAWNAQGFEVTR